jgi:23S rRNA (guanosine2251-2'-O)-methyltransferase
MLAVMLRARYAGCMKDRHPGRKPRPQSRPGQGGNPTLLYGLHAVAAAWINPGRRIRRLSVTAGGLEQMSGAIAQAAAMGLSRPKPTLAERHELDRMVGGDAVHQGIVLDAERLEEPSLDDVLVETADRSAALLFLDHVTDPHNVGAILRSASAFGAAAVVVTRHHAPEITGALAKIASGAVEHVNYVAVPNLARALEAVMDAGFLTLALDERGEQPLSAHAPFHRTALVMGAEGEGLRRLTLETCQFKAKLPTGGPVGSLNVSNAAAVALYEIARGT